MSNYNKLKDLNIIVHIHIKIMLLYTKIGTINILASAGRHRNMYNLTGLPGFVRFAHSPGCIGRSPTGLGPCAQYLAETGQLQNTISNLSNRANTQAPYGFTAPYSQQRLQFLKANFEILKSQLEQIRKEIEELESNTEGE